MAANLSKGNVMGSCMNGHLNKNENSMSEPTPNQDKVVILDAGAQYGKVFLKGFRKNIFNVVSTNDVIAHVIV